MSEFLKVGEYFKGMTLPAPPVLLQGGQQILNKLNNFIMAHYLEIGLILAVLVVLVLGVFLYKTTINLKQEKSITEELVREVSDLHVEVGGLIQDNEEKDSINESLTEELETVTEEAEHLSCNLKVCEERIAYLTDELFNYDTDQYKIKVLEAWIKTHKSEVLKSTL